MICRLTLQLAELDLWESKSAPLGNLAAKLLNKLHVSYLLKHKGVVKVIFITANILHFC